VQRAALAANRSLDVLSFLAANPSQGHTLTELARGLGVNPSSMHGILAVMTDSGFLLRHPSHKTYRLGPMAAAVGQASYEQNPSIDLARQELARLAEEFDLQAAVVASIEDSMIVVGRHGPATGEFLTFVGQRVPHAPPFGSIFAAWASSDRAAQWLQAAEPPLDEAQSDAYRRVLEDVRAEGRAILVVHKREFRFASARVSTAESSGLLVPLEAGGSYRLFYVGVPIFNSEGEVSLGLFVDGPPSRLGVEKIEDVAERLEVAARAVITRTGGQVMNNASMR
jgi:DNA-binding IclR family transcriptional regulator